MFEEWRDIAGYENLYQVSNFGQVRHTQRIGKPIKQSMIRNGYMKLLLCKDNKTKTVMVHRLVALAFVENPENKAEVNHKDGNKKNNSVDNLEWMTRSENLKHRYQVLGQTNKRKAS